MKKKSFIALLIGAIIGAATVIAVYFLTEGNVEWREYIETKLFPNALASVTALAALYVGASPVLSLVKNAASRFLDATDKVTKTAENSEQNNKTLAEYDNRISAFESRFDSEDEKLASLEDSVGKLEKIMRIAFGNMDELVKKGYAAEIGKVGKDSERQKNKP